MDILTYMKILTLNMPTKLCITVVFYYAMLKDDIFLALKERYCLQC